MRNKKIRTRFAPSPTGSLHIGGVRTALFNFLFARKNQGIFVLRIEDTDKERSDLEYEREIIGGLKWLGLSWDEGPDSGGKFSLYRQSERKKIYKKYLEKLLKEKRAYYCFCTAEELEEKRQYQISQGLPPHYNGKCSRLSDSEVKKNLEGGRGHVIRFKVSEKKISVKDAIRGEVEFDTKTMGDFIIAKGIDSPLYNFAVVVDDYEMGISHVIRGEEHLPNTPRQILIQEALGFSRPRYAHLPLILGPDKSKLSKRHGATSLDKYKKEGYLPEAIVNFLAFLGWNPGDEREAFSLEELIEEFSIERIHKPAAIFNIDKLNYLNGFYIRQKDIKELTQLCIPYLKNAGLIIEAKEGEEKKDMEEFFAKHYLAKKTGARIRVEYIQKAVSLYQERLKKLSEIPELIDFFFLKDLEYDKGLLRWKEMKDKEISYSLAKVKEVLSGIEEWNQKNIKERLIPLADEVALELGRSDNKGYLLWPLRVALTGKKSSAGPFEVAEALGKELSISRVGKAVKKL